jgi:hypothetical protein
MTKPPPIVMVPAALVASVGSLLVAVAAYHAFSDPRGLQEVVISLVTGVEVAAERSLDGDLAGALRALLRV